MKLPNPRVLQALVIAFNKKHEVGASVIVTDDSGESKETTTRSEAWMLGGHTPVILLEGIAGAYSLARVSG